MQPRLWYAFSAIPSPWIPTARRSWFIIVNMHASPRCGSPTSQPVASSKLMTQVGAPSMPILVSIEMQAAPFRSPGLPSAPTRNFGTRNRLMPFTPGGASGSRASTR